MRHGGVGFHGLDQNFFFTVKGQWFIYLIYYLINLDNILDVIKYTHGINSLSFEVVDNGIQRCEGLVIGAHLDNFKKFHVKAKLGKRCRQSIVVDAKSKYMFTFKRNV